MRFESLRLSRFSIGLALILVSGLATSCLEEINDVDKIGEVKLTPEVATPIARSTFGLKDFLESFNSTGLVKTDEDGFITLVYGEQLTSQSASELFRIQDQYFTQIVEAPGSYVTPVPVTATIPISVSYADEFVPDNEERLDSLVFKTGTLSIALNNTFRADGDIVMRISSLQQNGQPLEVPFTWSYDGSTPIVVSEQIDLTGYSAVLSNGTSYNSFEYTIEGELQFNNETITISEDINIDIRLSNVSFSGIFGYLGFRSVGSDYDTLLIDVFSNVQGGNFLVDDPRFHFYFDNSFGLTAQIDFQEFVARSNADQFVSLTGAIKDNLQVIAQPGFDQVGEFASSTITIDKNNSNIVDIIQILPEEIVYQMEGFVGSPDVTEKSFALDTSRIDLSYEVELPLSFSLEDLYVTNTFDFAGEDFKNVISFDFVISTTNGFPLDFSLQAYFLDDRGEVMDSLFTGESSNVLAPAQIDADGLVVAPGVNTLEIAVTQERADIVKTSSQIRLEARAATSGDIPVKIRDDYQLDIRIGAYSEIEISASGN